MREQEVRERAYAIWEREGRPPGRDVVHWFQAETEIASAFPEDDFRAFAKAASAFFPALLSDEDLSDRSERRRHFDWSWQAVRYRYRLCTECCGEFKALLAKPSEVWTAGWPDEEINYQLERCIYVFCMSGLSVLESFIFCLYFLGNAIRPTDFPHSNKPRRITPAATSQAFTVTFPRASITRQLVELHKRREYIDIDRLRNILAHRLAGRRSIAIWGMTHADGSRTEVREENWHLPGSERKLSLDDGLLQRHLTDVVSLVTALASASREFAESNPS